DHYFGTYPVATNPEGVPQFFPSVDTPTINGLSAVQPTAGPFVLPSQGALFSSNGNTVQPFLIGRNNAVTCDQSHGYQDEQRAIDAGAIDHFALPSGQGGTSQTGIGCQTATGANLPGYTMSYYDGNTVTAYWNYAQNFAMSDNSFGTTFGPSTPGAINLISGQTHGIQAAAPNTNAQMVADGLFVSDGGTGFTLIDDVDSSLDDCGSPTSHAAFTDANFPARNVGDLLNEQGISWGWFGGGFAPTTPATATKPAVCGAASTGHPAVTVPPPGATLAQIRGSTSDYVAHHTPFQHYASTANPHHLPFSSAAKIGKTDQANHQYDLNDFFTALKAGNLPAVSYLKAKKIENGHPGNTSSDPLSEQAYIVNTINAIMSSPFWKNTAIIIAYDDSDGWYDHVTGPLVNASASSADAFQGPGKCGTPTPGAYQGRCGYGPRLPLLVISPFAKQNYVDHNLTDQTSVLRFIEENWNLGFIDGAVTPPAGTGSFDRVAGQINGMFDFDKKGKAPAVLLDPSQGTVVSSN
ncbi:MAG TPA: alkaline phosphatase family protein, partial [Aliidongia sp.]|nr:alkaline phosphatase family protein [Aliidongia sp.]